MAEPTKKEEQQGGESGGREKSKCLVCGTTSDEEILLQAERDGKPANVCVKCLPRLIHGQH